MLYKTICLHLLEQQPALHELLKRNRLLPPALARLATALQTRHEAWKEQLAQARPGSDPNQLASEALEIALEEIQEPLSHATLPPDNQALSLDAALVLILERTPLA